MLDDEPLWYPSREQFPYQPGVPDKQLWAIGMIVVQWSMTENFIDMSARNVIGADKALLEQYVAVGNSFQLRLAFWKAQVEMKCNEPRRSALLGMIPRIQALNDQRDQVVHRMWGGGMEGTAPSADGLPTTEAGLLPKGGEKITAKPPRMPFAWKAHFTRLRQMATEMATLNRDLAFSLFQLDTAHGHENPGGQVSP